MKKILILAVLVPVFTIMLFLIWNFPGREESSTETNSETGLNTQPALPSEKIRPNEHENAMRIALPPSTSTPVQNGQLAKLSLAPARVTVLTGEPAMKTEQTAEVLTNEPAPRSLAPGEFPPLPPELEGTVSYVASKEDIELQRIIMELRAMPTQTEDEKQAMEELISSLNDKLDDMRVTGRALQMTNTVHGG